MNNHLCAKVKKALIPFDSAKSLKNLKRMQNNPNGCEFCGTSSFHADSCLGEKLITQINKIDSKMNHGSGCQYCGRLSSHPNNSNDCFGFRLIKVISKSLKPSSTKTVFSILKWMNSQWVDVTLAIGNVTRYDKKQDAEMALYYYIATLMKSCDAKHYRVWEIIMPTDPPKGST